MRELNLWKRRSSREDLQKTLNLVISRCCFFGDGKEMFKNINARAQRLFLLIKPIVCSVLVAVAVITKAPD